MTITGFTKVPNRQASRQTLVDEVNTFFSEVGQFVTDANATATQVNNDKDTTVAARDVTTGARDAAIAARDVATGARDAAEGFKDTAETAAAAAQSAAGLPSLAGNAGKFLSVNGDENGVLFDDVPVPTPPGLVLLSTQTVTSAVASVDFTTGIDGIYDEYEIRIYNFIPSLDSKLLRLRASTDGGSSFDSGATSYYYHAILSSDGTVLTNSGNVSEIRLTGTGIDIGSDGSENGASLRISMINPSASQVCQFHWSGMFTNQTNTPTTLIGSAQHTSLSAVNALRFFFDTGNIESGTIRLYGVRK